VATRFPQMTERPKSSNPILWAHVRSNDSRLMCACVCFRAEETKLRSENSTEIFPKCDTPQRSARASPPSVNTVNVPESSSMVQISNERLGLSSLRQALHSSEMQVGPQNMSAPFGLCHEGRAAGVLTAMGHAVDLPPSLPAYRRQQTHQILLNKTVASLDSCLQLARRGSHARNLSLTSAPGLDTTS
jgi:hypothetical protein